MCFSRKFPPGLFVCGNKTRSLLIDIGRRLTRCNEQLVGLLPPCGQCPSCGGNEPWACLSASGAHAEDPLAVLPWDSELWDMKPQSSDERRAQLRRLSEHGRRVSVLVSRVALWRLCYRSVSMAVL
jgi:hypothetical protein